MSTFVAYFLPIAIHHTGDQTYTFGSHTTTNCVLFNVHSCRMSVSAVSYNVSAL